MGNFRKFEVQAPCGCYGTLEVSERGSSDYGYFKACEAHASQEYVELSLPLLEGDEDGYKTVSALLWNLVGREPYACLPRKFQVSTWPWGKASAKIESVEAGRVVVLLKKYIWEATMRLGCAERKEVSEVS